jgi:hypothetical protein
MADAAAVTTDEAGGEGISKNALKKQVREQTANACNAKICGSHLLHQCDLTFSNVSAYCYSKRQRLQQPRRLRRMLKRQQKQQQQAPLRRRLLVMMMSWTLHSTMLTARKLSLQQKRRA